MALPSPRSDGDLNPAQNDYPRTGAMDPAELSSRPPSAKYDFNPGLDKREYNRDSTADVDDENAQAERRLAAGSESHTVGTSTPIPPTTLSDPADAAKRGVVLGLGIGTLAAYAALAVPGVGLILGGGAVIAALSGIAASASSSGVAGGIVGYLQEQGMPGAVIPTYERTYAADGAILFVRSETAETLLGAETVLRDSGAAAIDRYGDPA